MVNVGGDQEKEERDALTSSVAMDEENSNLLYPFNDLSFDSRSSKWTAMPLPQKHLTDQIYSPAPAPRKQKPSPRLLRLLRLRFPSPPRSLLPRSDLSAKAAVFDAILVSETCSWNLCCFFCVSDRRFLSLFFGWDRGIESRRIGDRGEMSMSISVMTFNLHEGDLPSDSPNSWAKRRDLCVSVITNYSPTILCTQGGLKWQLEYLQQCLPAYEQFGVSRKGSQDTTDEYCTIFYDKDKVELLEGGTFWLSESPSVPGSISWGATAPSIATWATFQLKRVEPPGFSFQIVNTNLDEFSHRARRRSALLTWQHIASLPPNLPVIYCGGFNSQKESTTGRFLLGRSREHGVVGDMRDAWLNARTRKNVSLIHTNHGFKGNKQGAMEFLKLILRALCLCWDRQTQDLHVDWILFRGRSLVPTTCEVVNDNIDGFYPSSHYPVFAEFMLPRSIRLVETS